MNGLDISLLEREGVTVMILSGSVDMSDIEEFEIPLRQTFSAGLSNLILDLGALNFMASIGLGVLIRAHRECRNKSGRLILVNPQPAIMKVFETTRLDTLFIIYGTVEEAMGEFSQDDYGPY